MKRTFGWALNLYLLERQLDLLDVAFSLSDNLNNSGVEAAVAYIAGFVVELA